jgi:hypothetical protein
MDSPNAMRPRLRTKLADPLSEVWTDADLDEAIELAVRAAWPHFYNYRIDESSYTGATAVPRETEYVDVPVDMRHVFRVEARMSTGTTAVDGAPWFNLKHGIEVVRNWNTGATGAVQTMQLKLHKALTATALELRIHGAVPLIIGAGTGVYLPAVCWPYRVDQQAPGFTHWVFAQSEYEARAMRRRSRATDKRDNNTLTIMAEQKASDLAKLHQMRPPSETDFTSFW